MENRSKNAPCKANGLNTWEVRDAYSIDKLQFIIWIFCTLLISIFEIIKMNSREDKSMSTPGDEKPASIEEKLVSFEAKDDSCIITPGSDNKSMQNEEESK